MNGERQDHVPSASTGFWEQLYQGRERPSNGIPNPVLASVATPLTPGRALDLGCALGDDAIWLGTRGWRVTAVDVSATALERASARSTELGVSAQIEFEQHDLAFTFPDGTYDFISAVYLQSPIDFRRDHVLWRATQALSPGGLLLVVTHGSGRPWAWKQDPSTPFRTPEESLAALELDPFSGTSRSPAPRNVRPPDPTERPQRSSTSSRRCVVAAAPAQHDHTAQQARSRDGGAAAPLGGRRSE